MAESELTSESPRAAVLWMIFGSFCFGTMNALVKWTLSLIHISEPTRPY